MNAFVCDACGESTERVVLRVGEFDIVQCPRCELRFVPPASIRDVDYDELYSEKGEYSDKLDAIASIRAGKLDFPRARRVTLEEVQQIRPATLMEIGCGVGSFLAAAENMGIETYGSDVSQNAISAAGTHLRAKLHRGIFTRDVLDAKPFDMVCTWEVLEHISEVTEFLKIIFDRLNPGGHVYLSTPNYDSRYQWDDMPADSRSSPPVHVSFWNKRSLAAILRRIGFEGVQVRHYSVPLSAARRSGGTLGRWLVFPDTVIRPSQRATLLGSARKPV